MEFFQPVRTARPSRNPITTPVRNPVTRPVGKPAKKLVKEAVKKTLLHLIHKLARADSHVQVSYCDSLPLR